MNDRVLVIAVETSSPHWSDAPEAIRLFINGEPWGACGSWDAFFAQDVAFGFTDAFIIRVIPGVR